MITTTNSSTIKDNPALDMMDGPIPGQSLTAAPGSKPYEQPPKYVDPEGAMVAIMNSITAKDTGVAVGLALEKGIYASDLANTILMGGVAQGKWTPDVAALIAKRTLGAVVAVGNAQGVKDIQYMKPKDNEAIESLLKMPDMKGKKNINPSPSVREIPIQGSDEETDMQGVMGV